MDTSLLAVDLDQIAQQFRAARYRRSLAAFVRAGWEILEPGTRLIWNWHLDVICAALERVARGETRNLIINIPPGHMKSLLVSVFFPAWRWLSLPEWRVLCSSYAMDLSIRDSVRARDLIESDWYQSLIPRSNAWELAKDENQKKFFSNTRKGFRLSLSVGSKATGFRGDCLICDDPHNVRAWPSAESLENVYSWWTIVMSSRLNNQIAGSKIVIQQRVHENDLSGRLIRQGGYEVLCLPSEYEPEATTRSADDRRTVAGELLFPALFPPKVIEETKATLGPWQYAGQHQQRPAPAAGGLFKRSWLRFWYPREMSTPPPPVLDDDNTPLFQIPAPDFNSAMQIQSWDTSFKDTAKSDFVAGHVWGKVNSDFFLIAREHGRMGFVETTAAVERMCLQYPQAFTKLIEDKANGPAIIDTLASRISGIVPINPEGGKEARASAVTGFFAAGNVYLPHPCISPEIHGFIKELLSFPRGGHDDDVDAMTQALNWIANNTVDAISIDLSLGARTSPWLGGGLV